MRKLLILSVGVALLWPLAPAFAVEAMPPPGTFDLHIVTLGRAKCPSLTLVNQDVLTSQTPVMVPDVMGIPQPGWRCDYVSPFSVFQARFQIDGLLAAGSGVKIFEAYWTDAAHVRTQGAPELLPYAMGAPEPETWAMLVAGFGLAGFRLRRQRKMGTLPT